MCGVGRSTLGYWIRSKRLRAIRTGRNYRIPVEELLLFLKATGQPIPEEIADGIRGPCFRTVQNCWQYFADDGHGRLCNGCPVFFNKVEACFTARDSGALCCPSSCLDCELYTEIYEPRIQFVRQLDVPAAICKGLEFWGGNKGWADLCGVDEKGLPGMGIEQVVHQESMEAVISNAKRNALGNPTVPRTYSIFLKTPEQGKLRVRISVYPLGEPAGTSLLVAERQEG